MPIVINEGEEDEMRLPTRNEVCWRCAGDGTHDAWEGGMTASDIAEQDDDFIDRYRAGAYSVPCSECNGKRVLAVLDEERATPEQLAAYEAHQRIEWEMAAEQAAERLAGC